MQRVLRSTWFWLLAIPLLLLGLYALLGFKLAPALLRSQAQEFVREHYGRELKIGAVRVHPFKLQLEIRDLALPDADGERMLAAERLFADLELASLWKRSFVFREVSAEGPFIRAVVRPGGAFNLADLALPDDPEQPDEPLPALLIERFALERGTLDFLDQDRRRPYRKILDPLNLELQQFRTTPDGGAFSLAAKTENAELVEWQGRIALEPVLASAGSFAIHQLLAAGVGEYLEETLPFALAEGHINLAGSYSVRFDETLDLELELPNLKLAGLVLRSRDANPVQLELPAVGVSLLKLNLPEQVVNVGRVQIERATAETTLEKDGSIGLLRLLGPASPDSPPTLPAAPTPPAQPWHVEIAALALEDARLGLTDRMLVPGTRFELAPLDLNLSPVTLDTGKALPLTLRTGIDGRGTLTLDGEVTLEPFAAGLDLVLGGMDLQKLQPYALAGMDLRVEGGVLGTRGRLAMQPAPAAGPELRYTGGLRIDGLRTVDKALEQDFFNAERIELAGLDYAMAPDALSIASVALHRPYANVILSSDQVLNLSAVLDPQGTAKALVERQAAAAADAARPKQKAKKTRKSKKNAAPPAAPAAPAYVEGMPIRVAELRMVEGTVDFADFFVQPNFQARIESLDGTIKGVSSKADSRAVIVLAGNVGPYSPVTIGGELEPFAFDRFTDVEMKFENISLPIFNPYSGRLAGYSIAKGKLFTELDYLIVERQLDAKHRIRIDQLEWGEKTATQQEATLPVKLATALLKDRDGVIQLDLPVTGTLDDPKFRIGPIVWQIVRNILTKAVTAPFALFGSLFKGAEEAQFVDFAPGEAALAPAAQGALKALGSGLYSRPEVKVDVPVAVVPELDRPALERRAWEQALAAAGSLPGSTAAPAPAAAYEALPNPLKAELLRGLIAQRGAALPAIQPPAPPPEGTERAQAEALAAQSEVDQLEAAARALVRVEEGMLRELGEERARAIQSALLADTQLEPARVFLNTSGPATAHAGKVRYELGIK